nr:hypothetical protein HK105_001070 [Polyrhizophydium stewartii]
MNFLRSIVSATVMAGRVGGDDLRHEGVATAALLRLGIGARPAGPVALDDAQSLLALALDDGSVLLVGDKLEVVLRQPRPPAPPPPPPTPATVPGVPDRSVDAAIHQQFVHFDQDARRPSLPGGTPAAGVDADRALEPAPAPPALRLAFKHGDKMLVGVGPPDLVVVWDLAQPELEPLCVRLGQRATAAFDVSPLSPWIAVGLESGAVCMVDAQTGQISHDAVPPLDPSGTPIAGPAEPPAAPPATPPARPPAVPPSASPVRHALFAPNDANLLLLVLDSGLILMWDLTRRLAIKRYVYVGTADPKRVAPLPCLSVCWRPDAEQFVAAYTDNQLVFWNVKSDWIANVTASRKRDETRKPALVRPVLATSAPQRAAADKAARDSHPIMHIDWVPLLGEQDTAILVGGGLPLAGPDGIACLILASKVDLKPSTITEIAVPLAAGAIGLAALPPALPASSSAQPQPLAVVVVDASATVTALALHGTSLTALRLPPSLAFDAPSFDPRAPPSRSSLFAIAPGSENIVYELNTIAQARTHLEPLSLPLAGARIRRKNTRRITDIICVVRPNRMLEFWECSMPTPLLLMSLPFDEWLPSAHIDAVHLRFARQTLMVQLGPYVVVHKFVPPIFHRKGSVGHQPGAEAEAEVDIDAMMAKLDATMDKVIEDSAAINTLISHQASSDAARRRTASGRSASTAHSTSGARRSDSTDIQHDASSAAPSDATERAQDAAASPTPSAGPPKIPARIAGHSGAGASNKESVLGSTATSEPETLPEPSESIDHQSDNQNVWFTLLETKAYRSAACWRPLFQAIHASEVELCEYADWLNILATSTRGHIHFTDTITGRELLTAKIPVPNHIAADPRMAQQRSTISIAAMQFLPAIVGPDPMPRMCLVAVSTAGTLLAFQLGLNEETRQVTVQPHIIFHPKPSSQIGTGVPQASEYERPLLLAVLDASGLLVRPDRYYSAAQLPEEYFVIATPTSVRVLVKEGADPISQTAFKYTPKDHAIVKSSIAYILNGTPHVIALTHLGRMLVYELPALDLVASIPLPETVDASKLSSAHISEDGRLGCWMADGHWEMLSLISDRSSFPDVEVRLYDMYRAHQWHQSRGLRPNASGRNPAHDSLCDQLRESANLAQQAREKLNERGERLQQLETKFGDLAGSSKTFVDTIREYNERQANKAWWQF